jgi:hypothetical protein
MELATECFIKAVESRLARKPALVEQALVTGERIRRVLLRQRRGSSGQGKAGDIIVWRRPRSTRFTETPMPLLVYPGLSVQPDRSVIIVTHDNRIFHFGDRIAHMDDGHIVGVEANQYQETSPIGR